MPGENPPCSVLSCGDGLAHVAGMDGDVYAVAERAPVEAAHPRRWCVTLTVLTPVTIQPVPGAARGQGCPAARTLIESLPCGFHSGSHLLNSPESLWDFTEQQPQQRSTVVWCLRWAGSRRCDGEALIGGTR